MNAFEYFVKVLKNYINFRGRARRKEYWYYTLISFIISSILQLLDYSIQSEEGIFNLLFTLGTIIPSIAVGVRRMHDVGKSGWFLLIPVYNLILACTNGDEGTNEYGDDPKGDPLQEEINEIGNN